jgi:hypothetical protein
MFEPWQIISIVIFGWAINLLVIMYLYDRIQEIKKEIDLIKSVKKFCSRNNAI